MRNCIIVHDGQQTGKKCCIFAAGISQGVCREAKQRYKEAERKLQKNALPIAYVRKKSYLCSGNAKYASNNDKKMLKSRKIRMMS